MTTSTIPRPPTPAPLRRRPSPPPRRVALTLFTVAALTVGLVLGVARRAEDYLDPVSACAVADLNQFVAWLQRNDAQGYVGEVGWPSGDDAKQWNTVAGAWFDRADAADLWVTAWAAGRWWPRSYRMAIYRLTGHPNQDLSAGAQAHVLGEHPGSGAMLRGVVLPGGAFGAGVDGPASYTATNPGVLGRDYYYDGHTDFAQLAGSGVTLARVSFTWERVQHRIGGPLDAREITRLRRVVVDAHRSGIAVVLDLHNFGDYWVSDGHGGSIRLVLGSSALPGTALADLWRRLSVALSGLPGVAGLGLMNEPAGMAQDPARGARVWQRISQTVVDSVRSTGDRHTLMVSGYGGASTGRFPVLHPHAWIRDPLHRVRYEAHQYFDAEHSGLYAKTFAQESAAAVSAAGLCTSGVRAGNSDGGSASTTIPVRGP